MACILSLKVDIKIIISAGYLNAFIVVYYRFSDSHITEYLIKLKNKNIQHLKLLLNKVDRYYNIFRILEIKLSIHMRLILL